MPDVWYVPTNALLEGAHAGDFVLTPTGGDRYLVGEIQEPVEQGPHWFGHLSGTDVPGMAGSGSGTADRGFLPDQQDGLLRAVEGVHRNRGEDVAEPQHHATAEELEEEESA